MNQFTSELKAWPKFYSEGKPFDFNYGAEYCYKALGIPRRYADAQIHRIDACNAEQVELINDLWQMVNSDKPKQALVCTGVNHCGKTYIACSLINYLDVSDGAFSYKIVKGEKVSYQTKYRPRYVNEADLLDRITSFGRTVNWFEIYTDLSAFLVIDEFGSTKWSANEARKVNQVLNKRFNNGYQTAIFSNRKPQEIFDLFNDDIKTRFYGCHNVTMRRAVELGNYERGNSRRDDSWLDDEPDFF